MEIRRYYPGQPTTGVLYGEALGIGWLSSQEKIDAGHQHYVDEGWNKLRIVAKGPRIQTWVNGHIIEDLVNEEVYKTHKKGSSASRSTASASAISPFLFMPDGASRRASR